MTCGDQTFKVKKGDLAILPKDVPHTFRNIGKSDARLLVIIVPGNFEHFLEEASRLESSERPDPEALARLAMKYDLEIPSEKGS